MGHPRDCVVCGHVMISDVCSKEYDGCGLPSVWLNNVTVRNCHGCGNEELIIRAFSDLHHLIAFNICSKDTRFTKQEVKFLRKYLNMEEDKLGKYLQISGEIVKLWEEGKLEIDSISDRMLRFLMVIQLGCVKDCILNVDYNKESQVTTMTLEYDLEFGRWGDAK